MERGSKIVTVVNDNVILQMPRGNLETIQPRALTLHTAGSLICKCDYKRLFQLFRKHRINMNLIVDHQPQTFLLNVARFVQQINDPNDISLFLSELTDVDVTRGIYKDFYNQVFCFSYSKSFVCIPNVCRYLRKSLKFEVVHVKILNSYFLYCNNL